MFYFPLPLELPEPAPAPAPAPALTADGVYTAKEVNYAQIATTSDATMLQPRGVAGGRPGVSPHIDRRTH